MSDFEVKVPTSQEEMEALRKSLRSEINDGDLDAVVGGNDDIKGKGKPTPWICPACGATVMARQYQDCAKHMVKCPNNPYK